MPVISLNLPKLSSILGKPIEAIVDTLPYLGLDIEGLEGDNMRVEYSPNRPDYGSEVGILRGLSGLFGIETGTPQYTISPGSTQLIVEEGVNQVRPIIVGMVARGVKLDDESIRQLILLQEDLHNGVGRRRRVASIGLHDFKPLKPPIRYTVVDSSFEFTPLGSAEPMPVMRVLHETEQGRKYGSILSSSSLYPLLLDSMGNVLSMPPIINGNVTVITEKTEDLFVDVTATLQSAAETCLNVLASHLSDTGAKIESIEIIRGSARVRTPSMGISTMAVELRYIQKLLGLKLSADEAIACLARSRLTASIQNGLIIAQVPCYRSDIIHPVDLVEEVALGYFVGSLRPSLPRFKGAGSRSPRMKLQNLVRDTMVGLGYTEVITPSLVSSELVTDNALRVGEPKSSEYEYLRERLTPSIMHALSRNRHESYPQRIFELGRVFKRDGRSPLNVREEVHVAAATAHASASFTEIRSVLESLVRNRFQVELQVKAGTQGPFAKSRCGIIIHERPIGYVGEVDPEVLANLGLEVPVALFELNLEPFLPKSTF